LPDACRDFAGGTSDKLSGDGQGVFLAADLEITVLCVDDHAIVREGVVSLVEGDPDLKVVGEAESGEQAIAAFRETRPDVTVMDLRLPDRDGVDVIKELRKDFPHARFVVLTSSEGDMDMRRAMEAGAQAYVIKGAIRKELRQIIKTVHAGGRYIPAEVALKIADHLDSPPPTARELEVLKLVGEGLRNKEIAGRLSIGEDTVKMHLRNVMRKLDVNDRTHAVMLAVRRGLIRA
jgi:DNA-binding NarL/FixJ family response regulator